MCPWQEGVTGAIGGDRGDDDNGGVNCNDGDGDDCQDEYGRLKLRL